MGAGVPDVEYGSGTSLILISVLGTIPPGKQTNNRAELVAIILAVRRAMGWPTDFNCLVVHSDSRICTDGITKWMSYWEADGWTRRGRRLENADL